ncbi:LysR family transcriptional regulator [Neptunomonas sp.]|uniref:helix-turn-helix domain-containing protein n=1 Tax=Neptunomonas sp. TaxID=1971898 RepID=UPI00344EA4B8
METFAVVVEAGSFTAAERLGLSKSFVSKQVSLLERYLRARLLYRTTRKLRIS